MGRRWRRRRRRRKKRRRKRRRNRRRKRRRRDTPFFFYKNLVYKNIRLQNCPKFKNMLRTCQGFA